MSNNPQGVFGGITQGVLGGPNQNTSAPTIDTGATNAALGQLPTQAENATLGQETALANGTGPSAATALLNQQTATTMAANGAAASSGSGGSGLAKRQAMEANSSALQNLGGQAATARAQEQLGGIAAETGTEANMGQQAIGAGQIQAGLATNQGQLTEQQQQTNAQAAASNQKANAGLLSGFAGAASGALSFLDADFKEPAPPGSKDEHGAPPAHFTLREERANPGKHKAFMALIDRTTGQPYVIATRHPTESEMNQLYEPHAAGALDSPDRKTAEMHDLPMGGGMGQGAGMAPNGKGASPGFGLGGGGSSNPMGALKQFSNDATAYGKQGGATGPGAGPGGPQYADADVGQDERFAEMVRRAHPGLYKAATKTYSDADVGNSQYGGERAAEGIGGARPRDAGEAAAAGQVPQFDYAPVSGTGSDPIYQSTPDDEKALGAAMREGVQAGKDETGRFDVPGYTPPTEANNDARINFGQGSKSKEEQSTKDAAAKAAEDKQLAFQKAELDRANAAAPPPEKGHGVAHDILTAIRGALGGYANPTGAGAKPGEATADQQRQKEFADKLNELKTNNDPRAAYMAQQGPEHFVPPAPATPPIVAPPATYQDAEARGPYATRGTPQDGDSAPGTTEQLGPEDPYLAAVRREMAASDQSAKGTKTYSDADVRGNRTEQRGDEDPRLLAIRTAMAKSDDSAKGTKTYSDGELDNLRDKATPTLQPEVGARSGAFDQLASHEGSPDSEAIQHEMAGEGDKPEAQDRGFDHPVEPYKGLPEPSIKAASLIPGLHSSGYRTYVNERGENEMDVPEEKVSVSPSPLARTMGKKKQPVGRETHEMIEDKPTRTSTGNRRMRRASRTANATFMDGEMDPPIKEHETVTARVPRMNTSWASFAGQKPTRKEQLQQQLRDVDRDEDASRTARKQYQDADVGSETGSARQRYSDDVDRVRQELDSQEHPVDLDAVVPSADDPYGWPAANTTYAPTEDPAAIPANFPVDEYKIQKTAADMRRMNPYGTAPARAATRQTPALAALFPAPDKTAGAGPVDFMQALHLANKKYDVEGGLSHEPQKFAREDAQSRRIAREANAKGLDVVPGEYEQISDATPSGKEHDAVVAEELRRRSESRKAIKALVAKWEADRKRRRQFAAGDLGNPRPGLNDPSKSQPPPTSRAQDAAKQKVRENPRPQPPTEGGRTYGDGEMDASADQVAPEYGNNTKASLLGDMKSARDSALTKMSRVRERNYRDADLGRRAGKMTGEQASDSASSAGEDLSEGGEDAGTAATRRKVKGSALILVMRPGSSKPRVRVRQAS